MKKNVLTVLSLLALVFVLGSCKMNYVYDDIVGTWRLASLNQGGTTVTGTMLAAIMTSTINASNDTTYSIPGTLASHPTSDSGTWAESESATYTFTSSSGSYTTYTLSGLSLTTTIPLVGTVTYGKE